MNSSLTRPRAVPIDDNTDLTVADLVRMGRYNGGLASPLLNLASIATVGLSIVHTPASTALAWTAIVVALVVMTLRSRDLHYLTDLGRHLVSRVLLITSVAIIADTLGTLDLLALIVLFVLATVVIAEPAARKLHTYGVSGVSNLPGFTTVEQLRWPLRLLMPGSLVALVSTMACALLGTGWQPAAVVTGALFLLAAWSIGHSVLRILRLSNEGDTLNAALAQYGPTFVLYWRADAGTDFQVAMWLPYLERLGRPFFVLVRTGENFDEAVRLTDRPVILRRSLADLDAVIVPSLRTAFYVNNAAVNSHFVRFPGINHVMLNHGDSDKAPSFNPVSRMYDRNFVAGQAAVDRFGANGVAVHPDQFVLVGRPQIAGVTTAAGPIGEVSRPRVLYAPTWAGFTADAHYSSLPLAMAIVGGLVARGCDVVFRPHPYSYRSPELAAICTQVQRLLRAGNEAGARHLFGERTETAMTVVDCFNASDAMICDVSSVAADYLASEKPLAMAAVHCPVEDFADEFPLAAIAYLLQADGEDVPNLDDVLERLLRLDPQREARREMKTYYLRDPGAGSYVDLFLAEAAPFV